METELMYVYNDSVYTINVVQVNGCDNPESNDPIHDGVECCHTEWTWWNGDQQLETLRGEYTTIVPGCIVFDIGQDLVDTSIEPMEVYSTRSQFCTRFSMDSNISIGVRCTLCGDVLLAPVECIQFSPADLPEMLNTVLRHARTHSNVRAAHEFCTVLDHDECHDVRHYFEGRFTCTDFYCVHPQCVENDDGCYCDMDYNPQTLTLSQAIEHHTWFMHRRRIQQAHTVASANHDRIGEESPVRLVDSHIIQNIFSLLR